MFFGVNAAQGVDYWRELATVAQTLRDRYMIDPKAPKKPDPLEGMEWESGGGG